MAACSSPSGGDGGTGGGAGGGSGGSFGSAFEHFTLDPQSSELSYLAMAQQGDRIGAAYFVSIAADAGETWEVRYAEWQAGQVKPPQKVQTVRRAFGLALAFQSNGEPAVAYLGGDADTPPSVYWLNSDAALSYRSGGSTWTEQLVADRGNEVTCGNPVSDTNGYLVGLSPALTFDGAKAYFLWRDGHYGQSVGTGDYEAADIELAEGGPTAWQKRCVVAGGNTKLSWGGHMQLIMAEGQPALVTDQVQGWEGPGHGVFFLRRNADGSWTAPRSILPDNTQFGPSLAYDSVVGFGIATVDPNTSHVRYVASKDGVTWTSPDSVFQYGSGGWYASLAFDPINHEPAVAYYLCSEKAGVTALSSCPPGEDGLYVRQRIGDNWRETLVDGAGAYLPKMGFLSSGKRVVVYRLPQNGQVRIAVEK